MIIGYYWISFCSTFIYVLIKEWMEERRQLLRSYDRIVTPRIEISTLPTIYEE